MFTENVVTMKPMAQQINPTMADFLRPILELKKTSFHHKRHDHYLNHRGSIVLLNKVASVAHNGINHLQLHKQPEQQQHLIVIFPSLSKNLSFV